MIQALLLSRASVSHTFETVWHCTDKRSDASFKILNKACVRLITQIMNLKEKEKNFIKQTKINNEKLIGVNSNAATLSANEHKLCEIQICSGVNV